MKTQELLLDPTATRDFLHGLLEPMDNQEVEYRIATSEARHELAQDLDERRVEILYDEVNHQVQADGAGQLDYRPFRELGKELEQQRDRHSEAAVDEYEQIRHEWEQRFQQASKVADELLGVGADQWLSEEWIKQGLLTRNLSNILKAIIAEKQWNKMLPLLEQVAKQEPTGNLRARVTKYTTKKMVKNICLETWKQQFPYLTLRENLELITRLEHLMENYPKNGKDKPRQEWETPFRHLLATQGRTLLTQRNQQAEAATKMLGEIMKAQGLNLKDLGWLDNERSTGQLFSDKFLAITVAFFKGIDDPEFFTLRRPLARDEAGNQSPEPLTDYEAWTENLSKTVVNTEREAWLTTVRKVGLEMAVGSSQAEPKFKVKI